MQLEYGLVGAWRSLVAHLVWDQRVEGSNPFAPTILQGLAGQEPLTLSLLRDSCATFSVIPSMCHPQHHRAITGFEHGVGRLEPTGPESALLQSNAGMTSAVTPAIRFQLVALDDRGLDPRASAFRMVPCTRSSSLPTSWARKRSTR